MSLSVLSSTRASAAVNSAMDFSPLLGRVAAVERPLRQEMSLNGRWQFQPLPVPDGHVWDHSPTPPLPEPKAGGWDKVPIKIPSPWNVNTWGNGRNVGPGSPHPYWPDSVYYPSYPKEWDHARMGWLRKSFTVPADWKGRRIVLHFEAVAGEADIRVNGRSLHRHFEAYLPFDVDVTAAVSAGKANELLVGIRHRDLFNKQNPDYKAYRRPYPNGSNTDNLAGIWQDVSLIATSQVSVADVFVKPDVAADELELELTLRNDSAAEAAVELSAALHPWTGKTGTEAPLPAYSLGAAALQLAPQKAVLAPGSSQVLRLKARVSGRLKAWSPESPNLYGALVSLKSGGKELDRAYQRFGWRQFRIKGRDIHLNGRKIQMVGDLSHPFGPFMMSRRFVWAWYKMIKDMGGNAVRPHAQPYPRYYMEVADEMGVVVLDENALFGSSICVNLQEPQAWERFEEHTRALVLRDRNYPSVVGWSVGNEMFAMFFDKKISAAEKKRWYEEGLSRLARIAGELDPTRDWLSCDGDEDLGGRIPIWSKHYGHNLHELPKGVSKPLMIGESGGTYYARPAQLAEFNGEKAFASYASRNDALAMDLYQNVVKVARPHLAYYSPSEMVWFGLEHLPLGYGDTSRVPGLKDGVFFSKDEEGGFGMQLERIPPYTGTLNPGFDARLPLYKPLAMFHAMKAAMAPGGPQPCAWDKIPGPGTDTLAPAPKARFTKAAFLGDRGGELFQRLYGLGVEFVEPGTSDQAGLLFIDGEALDTQQAAKAKPGLQAFLKKGGTAWVMLRSPKAASGALAALLPKPLEVTPRQATAMERGQGSHWLSDMGLPRLYFAQSSMDKQVVKAGLSGPLAAGAKVILKASNTDWSQFNESPEAAKCGAVVLYEHLAKPAGAVLIEAPSGGGTLLASSIDYMPQTSDYNDFWRLVLAKAGVALSQARGGWLVPTANASPGEVIWDMTEARPGPGWEKPGFKAKGWKKAPAGFGIEVPSGRPRTPWTSPDIWLRMEFESDSAGGSLKVVSHHDEDVEVYLNGVPVFQAAGYTVRYEEAALGPEAGAALKKGKNLIAVHCRQTSGGQYIDVGLSRAAVSAAPQQRAHDLLLDGPIH